MNPLPSHRWLRGRMRGQEQSYLPVFQAKTDLAALVLADDEDCGPTIA